MKLTHITKLAVGATLFVLSACGQNEASEKAPANNDTEASIADHVATHNWLPVGIILPQPHTVIQDAKLGTRTYLLRIVVADDPKEQFAQWQTALEQAGYEVNDSMLTDGRILFQGADVESGQIAVSQPEDQKGYMIQIDVSKVS